MSRGRQLPATDISGPATARGENSHGHSETDHVYKILELVGSSETSIEDAIKNAISRAAKTVREMKWFEVVQTRGHIENGAVRHYQVTLRVGSRWMSDARNAGRTSPPRAAWLTSDDERRQNIDDPLRPSTDAHNHRGCCNRPLRPK